jgi:hypothetical protein
MGRYFAGSVPFGDGRGFALSNQRVGPRGWLVRFVAEYGGRSMKRFMERFNAQTSKAGR